MFTKREQQEGNGVNGYHVKIHFINSMDGFQMTAEKQEQSA